MRIGVWVVLCLVTAACSKKLQAGKTPEETIRNAEAAMRQLDAGALYDMMSTRCQQQMDQMMSGVRSALAAVPDAQLKAAGFGGLKEMSPREMLVEAVDRAKDESPEALKQMESIQIAVMEVRNYGDRATVKIMTIVNGNQIPSSVPLVKEGNRWRIDSDDSLSAMPVNFRPSVADCTTFT